MMRSLTHMCFAYLVSSIILVYSSYGWFFVLFGVLFSLVPDIDTEKSKVGRKVFVLSWLLRNVFGHRSIFHSLVFGIVVMMVLLFFSEILGVAFAAGYFSHIVLDSLTVSGVQMFYPFRKKVKGVLKTGGVIEWVLGLVFVVVGTLVNIFINSNLVVVFG